MDGKCTLYSVYIVCMVVNFRTNLGNLRHKEYPVRKIKKKYTQTILEGKQKNKEEYKKKRLQIEMKYMFVVVDEIYLMFVVVDEIFNVCC